MVQKNDWWSSCFGYASRICFYDSYPSRDFQLHQTFFWIKNRTPRSDFGYTLKPMGNKANVFLVIRPGIGTKGSQTLSKNEMDDILRFGSQDLFKNEDEDSTKDVDYTDEMVAALLKREDKEDEGAPEEESNKLLDDYFR